MSTNRPLGARIARAVLAAVDKPVVDRSMTNAANWDDDFFRAPAAALNTKPGDLIKAEPFAAYYDPLRLFRCPAATWRIQYRSSGPNGLPLVVTGTLFVPQRPYRSGIRPLVSYAFGGISSSTLRDTPSAQMQRGFPSELSLVSLYLLRGWAVVVTDYPRYEDTMLFAITDAVGPATIDAARAAQQLEEAGLDPDGPVMFTGYSLGGHASAAAVEQAPRYASELNVVGATSGGGPSNFRSTARRAEHGPLFGCIMFMIAGLKAVYPDLPTDKLNSRGKEALNQAKRLRIEAAIVRYGFLNIRDFASGGIDDFLDEQPAWSERVDKMRLGSQIPSAPVYLYHGVYDPFNPFVAAERLRDDWRAGGAEVKFSKLYTEHLGAIGLGLLASHMFLGKQVKRAQTKQIPSLRITDTPAFLDPTIAS